MNPGKTLLARAVAATSTLQTKIFKVVSSGESITVHIRNMHRNTIVHNALARAETMSLVLFLWTVKSSICSTLFFYT
jgi:hypothetical protein